MFGAFLEIEMFKKRSPLWREARFEVKNGKNDGLGPLLGVEVLKKHASKPKWKKHSTFGPLLASVVFLQN